MANLENCKIWISLSIFTIFWFSKFKTILQYSDYDSSNSKIIPILFKFNTIIWFSQLKNSANSPLMTPSFPYEYYFQLLRPTHESQLKPFNILFTLNTLLYMHFNLTIQFSNSLIH